MRKRGFSEGQDLNVEMRTLHWLFHVHPTWNEVGEDAVLYTWSETLSTLNSAAISSELFTAYVAIPTL
jgi:hypothetical protein